MKIIILMYFLFIGFIQQIDACSIFCASKHGEVLAAGNEDWSDPNNLMWVKVGFDGDYSSVNFGHSDYQVQTAINEHGLFFDFAVIPKTDGKNLKDKLIAKTNLFNTILSKCKNITEALVYLKKYQYQSSYNQVLMADATGKSLVVNQDIVLENTLDYQIATNFNTCDLATGNYNCRRYQIINDGLAKADKISVPLFRLLLSRTHQEGKYPTQYSYIFDLKKGKIHLYSFHNYESEVVLDVKTEIANGYKMKSIKELFPVVFEEEYFRLHHKDSLKQTILSKIRLKGSQEGLSFYKDYSKKYPKAAGYPFILWDIGADLIIRTSIEESKGASFDYWNHPKKYINWRSDSKNIEDALHVYNQLEKDISGEDKRQYIGVYEMKAFIYLVKGNQEKSKEYYKKTLQVATEETGNYQRAQKILGYLNK